MLKTESGDARLLIERCRRILVQVDGDDAQAPQGEAVTAGGLQQTLERNDPQLGLDQRPTRVENDVLVVIGERHPSPREEAPEIDGAQADGDLQHGCDPLSGLHGRGGEEAHVDGTVQPLTRQLVEMKSGPVEVQGTNERASSLLGAEQAMLSEHRECAPERHRTHTELGAELGFRGSWSPAVLPRMMRSLIASATVIGMHLGVC